MTLEVGNEACTTGLSARLFAARTAAGSVIGLSSDPAPLKADCFALAKAIIDEITENAEAVIPVGLSGLQTSTAPGYPTGPSTAEFPLKVR